LCIFDAIVKNGLQRSEVRHTRNAGKDLSDVNKMVERRERRHYPSAAGESFSAAI
jgi:hypothetical protein